MKTKILFSYTENIIPKGCRKARDVRFDDGELEFDIPEVSAADAPVALRGRDEDSGVLIEWRWYDGSLWTSLCVFNAKPSSHTARAADWGYAMLPALCDLRDDARICNPRLSVASRESSKGSAIETLLRGLEDMLIIDGQLYRTARHLCYEVCTFGLGNNHGGTALMLSGVPSSSADTYFGLLERAEAIKRAEEVAAERGDTKDIPIRPHGPDFEVLIPEALSIFHPVPVLAPAITLSAGKGAWF